MQSRIKNFLFPVIACFLFVNASAEPPIPAVQSLTLKKAIAIAFEHSPYLQAVKSERDAGQTYREEAKGYRLPQVDLNEIYIRTNSPADVFGLQLNQEKFSLADFSMTDANHPSPINDYVTQLQISQPVYMGGKIKHGIRAGEKMAAASDKKLNRARQDVAFQTAKAYLNVLLAQRYVKLMDSVVATVQKHVDSAQAYFDTGFIMEADLLQAKVALGQMKQLQITAKNNARLALAYLDNVMGVDQSIRYELTDTFTFQPVSHDLNKLLETGLKNRPDLEEMQLKVGAAKEKIGMEESGYKPKVFLVGQLNYNDSSFGNFNGDSFKLMAVAKFNLFNGKRTHAKVRRAKSLYRSYKNFLSQMENGIRLQIKQALFRLQEAEQRYKVALLSSKQARENVKLREERYKKGVEKTTDLLDADTALQQAETNRLHALFDWLKAKENLKYMIGQNQ
ncbi:MAG: TolC family protein [Acidobacteria bacterium]|nr:TolC family protein [Acidobacteriota bacterium]